MDKTSHIATHLETLYKHIIKVYLWTKLPLTNVLEERSGPETVSQ